jgi:hypothetical protein
MEGKRRKEGRGSKSAETWKTALLEELAENKCLLSFYFEIQLKYRSFNRREFLEIEPN